MLLVNILHEKVSELKILLTILSKLTQDCTKRQH